MKILGHRNIQNTLLYTQLISFENDEFHSATVKTVQTPKGLLKQAFNMFTILPTLNYSEKASRPCLNRGLKDCGEAAGSQTQIRLC